MNQRLLIAAALVLLPLSASAQQRPLLTEDPETIGAGRILTEFGFDYGKDVSYPASGLEGNLLRLPLVGVSIGVSSIAELQIDGGFYNRLSITERNVAPLSDMVTATGDSTSSVEDWSIGMKIRLLSETDGRPAFGFRFATKLPNASNESGLGLDTTDFFASVLAAKTVQSIRTVANIGLGILGDPTRGDRQNDVLTYGFSMARALTQAAEIVGEINGLIDTAEGAAPPGTGSRGQVRVGARYTVGGWRGDAAILLGVTSRDPSIGLAAGFTYVFNAFTIP
jgi:Putative MetA-pathway of phenol degradation